MAGAEIVWRRGLAEMAEALRGLGAHFDCYLIPLGPDALNPADVRTLNADGKVEHVYEGPTEYLLRLEVGLAPSIVENASEGETVLLSQLAEGPFRPLIDCMAEWNDRLEIPTPDPFGFAQQEAAEQESHRRIILGEWHVMLREFASVLGEVVEGEHAVIEASEDETRESPIGTGLILRSLAPEDIPHDGTISEDEELHRLAEEGAVGNEPRAASLARMQYARQWHHSLSRIGREFFCLAVNHPEALTTRDLGPVVMAGMGKVHPVMSHFPKVLHAIPEQMAHLLPSSLVWLIWPGRTEWTRPSLALPSASALTWASVQALAEPGAVLPTQIIGHPLGAEAPAGYHDFFQVAQDLRTDDDRRREDDR